MKSSFSCNSRNWSSYRFTLKNCNLKFKVNKSYQITISIEVNTREIYHRKVWGKLKTTSLKSCLKSLFANLPSTQKNQEDRNHQSTAKCSKSKLNSWTIKANNNLISKNQNQVHLKVCRFLSRKISLYCFRKSSKRQSLTSNQC